MLALPQLQLDHVVRHPGEPAFGDLLAVAQAVPDIRAPADEASVLVEVAKRTLGARRGHFEVIAGGERIGLVEQGAERLAHALAIGGGDPLPPIDSDAGWC